LIAQRNRFGLGNSYRLRIGWAVIPRSSPRLEALSSGLNGAQGSD
jgi:hypothetical protein